MVETTHFIYDERKLAGLRLALSEPRFATYLSRAAGDQESAFKLYVWNTYLSEALYMPLQSLEVALRNSADRALTSFWGATWYDPTFLAGKLQAEQIQRVEKVLDKHSESKMGTPLTKDYIVANLGFAFWVDLFFFREYEKLWQFCLHRSFPNKQKGTQRSHVAPIIKPLHMLRNRVAHHEPIAWSSNPRLDQHHTNLLKLICWVSPETEAWIRQHSRFEEVWQNKPQ